MKLLEPLANTPSSPLDVQFSRFLKQMDGGRSTALGEVAPKLTQAMHSGHTCLNLNGYLATREGEASIRDWLDDLKSSPCVGNGWDAVTPLVLVETPTPRLYLYRLWRYERSLETKILEFSKVHNAKTTGIKPLASAEVERILNLLYPQPTTASSLQQTAVRNALTQPLTLVAGGPGTGKTTLCSHILAALLMAHTGEKPLRIALAAPTGKAAARMTESLHQAVHGSTTKAGGSGLEESIQHPLIQLTGQTLHRLLGIHEDRPEGRYNSSHSPLPYDIVVVDESSMIDLALMSKLFNALAADTRVLLLGDPCQLPSVDVGSVFGDWVAAIQRSDSLELKSTLTFLTESHRFKSSGGIGKLCKAIHDADTETALTLLKNAQAHAGKDTPTQEIIWHPLNIDTHEAPENLIRWAEQAYAPLLDANLSPEERYACLNAFRILCAYREGNFGIHALNRRIEARLLAATFKSGRKPPRHYAGRPVLISQNDSELQLFNGDTGITYTTAEGKLRVGFPSREQDGGDRLRQYSPLRLPEHTTAYAMTGHRAQGSEFDTVHLLLPPDSKVGVSREWLYTAVSRAKKQAVLWCSEAQLRKAILTPTQRASGLLMQSKPRVQE